MTAPNGTGRELGFSTSNDVTWGLSFHVCEIGILLPFPSFINMEKNVKILYKWHIIILIIRKFDMMMIMMMVKIMSAYSYFFICSPTKKIMSTFSVLSTALGSGVIEEGKTHGPLPDGAHHPAGGQTQGS